MNRISRVFILVVILYITSSLGFHRIDYRHTRLKNVCKDLKNESLVYFIFVDSRQTYPWTEFDIRSTLDSIAIAINWINQQATREHIKLRMKYNYYIGSPYTPVKKDLSQGTVEKTINTPNLKQGIREINSWADAICKKVGTSINVPDKDGIPEQKNPKNKERLIAFLRDENKVESVALVFLVNNYYRDDISVAVNTFNDKDVEFAIVSYKYPAEIAHNILALYGAAPMHNSLYRHNAKKIDAAAKLFPNDIMLDPYAKRINQLEIGEYTKYLIGWSDKLDSRYHDLLTDNFANF